MTSANNMPDKLKMRRLKRSMWASLVKWIKGETWQRHTVQVIRVQWFQEEYRRDDLLVEGVDFQWVNGTQIKWLRDISVPGRLA